MRIGKISLFCFVAFVATSVVGEETPTEPEPVAEEEVVYACGSICANENRGLSTPDLEIQYNWNPRVPVCAGKSCDSGTCAQLELKLPAFSDDETQCSRHQTGLQEAGCKCNGASSGNKSYLGGSMPSIFAAATAVAAVGMLL